jgi:DNA polymerase I-like protein with 3'-5' exonuclease and polymerase domains
MGDYHKYVDQHDTVEQLYSGRVRAGASFTERCNSYFQGLGADMAKDALYRVARAQHVGEMVARTCNFVHDEIVVETPEECVEETAREVESCMTTAAAFWLPDVPCGVEVIASKVYSKSAKRVVDAQGRLQVWHA